MVKIKEKMPDYIPNFGLCLRHTNNRICGVVGCRRKSYGMTFFSGRGSAKYGSIFIVPSIELCDEHLMLLREEYKKEQGVKKVMHI